MVVEPDSNGTEMTRMGLKWDSNGTQMTHTRLKWDSKEVKLYLENMVLEWDSNRAWMELKLDSNGIQKGQEWDSNRTRTELILDSNRTQLTCTRLKWDSSKTQMGLKWDLNETRMRLERDLNETWTRFEWYSNETQMRLKRDSKRDLIETRACKIPIFSKSRDWDYPDFKFSIPGLVFWDWRLVKMCNFGKGLLSSTYSKKSKNSELPIFIQF